MSLSVEVSGRFHQFRNASEVRSEAKGGYVTGRVVLPRGAAKKDFSLDLFLVAAKDDDDDQRDGRKKKHIGVGDVHPNLLHATGSHRLTRGDRMAMSPLTDDHWIVRINKANGTAVISNWNDVDVTNCFHGDELRLGGKDSLRLTVIKCNQKKDKDKDAPHTMKGVFKSRNEYFGGHMTEGDISLALSRFRASPTHSSSIQMHMVRLKTVFRPATGPTLQAVSNDVILDAGSKFTAEIRPERLTRNKICSRGNVELTVVAANGLHSRYVEALLVQRESDLDIQGTSKSALQKSHQVFENISLDMSGLYGIVKIPPQSVLATEDIESKIARQNSPLSLYLLLKRVDTGCCSAPEPKMLIHVYKHVAGRCSCNLHTKDDDDDDDGEKEQVDAEAGQVQLEGERGVAPSGISNEAMEDEDSLVVTERTDNVTVQVDGVICVSAESIRFDEDGGEYVITYEDF